jgi:hypothetical protein
VFEKSGAGCVSNIEAKFSSVTTSPTEIGAAQQRRPTGFVFSAFYAFNAINAINAFYALYALYASA